MTHLLLCFVAQWAMLGSSGWLLPGRPARFPGPDPGRWPVQLPKHFMEHTVFCCL
ncbi:uncharacterized protein THITE_2110172 [Thermothielavioides terrestris NRRL 8126]|uniref:Uncharacterized protein n=1 Tax=Thermothielavioides terrestris (strain ATCC 38088 / NRRL 8126) TaxID=578455 RepID=G2QRU3_THETT|nr:uncharacterized protein THITE_2110172 [Thermothielavioides terrestris NRRL 8126]AEO64237.1 hypothetical protein THITE_2110172 [Thermothielavioides terrestris NRRL 8126]